MFIRKPIFRIFEILKFQRKEIWAVYFYAVVAGIVQLILPLGIQSIISFVLGGSLSTSLVILIGFVVLSVFVNGLLQVNQMKVIEKIQQQLFVRYSFLYANKLHNIDLKSVKDRYLPELINRFFDVISLQKGIAKLLLDVPTAMIQILFGLLLLSFYHPAFIFFGLLLISILYIILQFTGSKGLETSIEESTHKYSVVAHLEEVARMARSYKFVNQSFALKKADQHIEKYLGARTSHFKVLLVQYWSLIGFKLLITAAMLVVGAFLLLNQQLNIGQFIAAEIVIILVINSVEKIIFNLDKVYDVLTSLEKINIVLDKPAEQTGSIKHSHQEVGMHVKCRDMSFTYGNNDVLSGLNIEIAAGAKLYVKGDRGSGKSTLMYLLSGIYRPSSGEVTLDNLPVNNYEVADLRNGIKVLFPETGLVTGTIMDNITMGKDIAYADVDEVAELTGLRQYITEISEGYEKVVQPSAYHLPDNVIQKIVLTRVLLTKPRLMLLDTPFKNITDINKGKVLAYISNKLKNTTVVIADTEDVPAEYFDEIIYLENGTITNTSR